VKGLPDEGRARFDLLARAVLAALRYDADPVLASLAEALHEAPPRRSAGGRLGG
jgi:hypothetical protein